MSRITEDPIKSAQRDFGDRDRLGDHQEIGGSEARSSVATGKDHDPPYILVKEHLVANHLTPPSVWDPFFKAAQSTNS